MNYVTWGFYQARLNKGLKSLNAVRLISPDCLMCVLKLASYIDM